MNSGGPPIFDLSVNLGNILTILSFIIGGIVFVLTVRSDLKILNLKVDTSDEANELRFTRVEAQADDTKIEIRKLGQVVVDLTKTQGRQDLTDERLLAQGRRLDEQSRLTNEIQAVLRDLLRRGPPSGEHRD